MKAGELQRTMSLLFFLRSHVILTLHMKTQSRTQSPLAFWSADERQ